LNAGTASSHNITDSDINQSNPAMLIDEPSSNLFMAYAPHHKKYLSLHTREETEQAFPFIQNTLDVNCFLMMCLHP
jgi:hypothetical protein